MSSVNEMRDQILERASEDFDFRQDLLRDPKSAIEAELDISIPGNIEVRVHEDGREGVNLVLPPKRELSAEELEAAVGSGASTWNYD